MAKLLKLKLMHTPIADISIACKSGCHTCCSSGSRRCLQNLCPFMCSLPVLPHDRRQAFGATHHASAAHLSRHDVIQMELHARGQRSSVQRTARLCLTSCRFPLLAGDWWRSRCLLLYVVSGNGHAPVASQIGALQHDTGLVMHGMDARWDNLAPVRLASKAAPAY